MIAIGITKATVSVVKKSKKATQVPFTIHNLKIASRLFSHFITTTENRKVSRNTGTYSIQNAITGNCTANADSHSKTAKNFCFLFISIAVSKVISSSKAPKNIHRICIMVNTVKSGRNIKTIPCQYRSYMVSAARSYVILSIRSSVTCFDKSILSE